MLIAKNPKGASVAGDDKYAKKRLIKDVCTQIVTETFFRHKENRMKFVELVLRTYNAPLRQFEKTFGGRCIMVYKGGNLLRLIEKNIVKSFPAAVGVCLSNFYSPYFKESDIDFSVYCSSVSEPGAREAIRNINFNAQAEVRKFVSERMDEYFDVFSRNQETQQREMNEFADAMNAALKPSGCQLAGPNSIRLAEGPVTDTRIDVDDRTGKTITTDTKRSDAMGLRIVDNAALEFGSKESLTYVFFDLVRTKYMFNLAVSFENTPGAETIAVGGELLDVSVPLQQETIKSAFSGSLAPVFAEYESLGVLFTGYSLGEAAKDLFTILFTETEGLPWNAPKYEKRLSRLMLLLFAQAATTNHMKASATELRKMLQYLKDVAQYYIGVQTYVPSRIKSPYAAIYTSILDAWSTAVSAGNNDEFLAFSEMIKRNLDVQILCIEREISYRGSHTVASKGTIYRGSLPE